MEDKDIWHTTLRNKNLKSAFEDKPGGEDLAMKRIFKTEDSKEDAKKNKQLEARIAKLEKEIKELQKDNMNIKRKLNRLTDRNNFNENIPAQE